MRDFLIKLLGGCKAVVVIVEKNPFNTKSVSRIAIFYPFVQMILKTKIGTVSFNKDMVAEFKENK